MTNWQRHTGKATTLCEDRERAPRADELIADLVDDLEFSLCKVDGPGRRRITRRYAVRFYYLAGEKPDLEDVDAVRIKVTGNHTT